MRCFTVSIDLLGNKYLEKIFNLKTIQEKNIKANSMEVENKTSLYPVAKIAEKTVCKSVFLTAWHCICSAELIKTHSFSLFFRRIFPLGYIVKNTLL